MANSSLSDSCRIFQRLCWPKLHGNVQPYFVEGLEFCHQPDEFGNLYEILKKEGRNPVIPIATTPPPEYILGFDGIKFSYLNDQIIEFMQNISSRLHKKIILSLETFMQKCMENDKQTSLLRRFLATLAIFWIDFSTENYENNLFDFNRLFPGFIYKVQLLDVWDPNDVDMQILFDWLMEQRADGKQKILKYPFADQLGENVERERLFLDRIKEEFATTTEQVNFLVKLEFEHQPIDLENAQTGEMLNTHNERDSEGELCYFLARYPQGEEHWKEKSVEKIYYEEPLKNLTYFALKIKEWKEMNDNRADKKNCSPNLAITDGCLAVTHTGAKHGYNSVRCKLSIPFSRYSMLDKYIACYYEVKILKQGGVGIGFSDRYFPLNDDPDRRNCLGPRRNSIGFWEKKGIIVEGAFLPFAKDGHDAEELLHKEGELIGCGLLHSPAKSSLKFFSTLNGELIGFIELPPKFIGLELFPIITLGYKTASLHINFGKEDFCFDRSKLFG